MPFIIVLILIIIIAYSFWVKSPKHKGKVGEARVHNTLTRLSDEYVLLDNVVLKTDRGTTQIDHIVVSKYGVFAIETKNYRGDIYGDDNRKEWTQIIATDVTYRKKWYKTYTYITKNHFYNPVKQAIGHAIEIKKTLSDWPYLKVIPIVVFTGDASLSNITSNNHVVYGSDLLYTIQSYNTVVLSDAEVNTIVNRLAHKNMREFVDDRTHIRNIKQAQRDMELKIRSGICPRCGGSLVKRTGPYGEFHGCSNYPKCKYITLTED